MTKQRSNMRLRVKTTRRKLGVPIAWLALLSLLTACGGGKQSETKSIREMAANEDVARYLEAFKGLGALTDSSRPTPPKEALENFHIPEDLALDLVLSEPQITQPVELSFDHRGRLWVVQYHQYPYPNGVKIVSVDNYLRVQFDKLPAAPPHGARGADKITFFEDTDGDGVFDQSTDAITGLNIATSDLTGRGRIWVLNPPYLLAYPDKNTDGIPDGAPEVKLEGFGLEDTHAVANSLRWGPDGWLYGAQGSTTTANISSSVSKNVAFQGQVIWRYHPDTEVFEVFAEGGGNTFNVEFDRKGRLFSGNNAYDRGPNFKQGGFYPRSLGKHGPYMNPYTFGNLPNMALQGDKSRFTHSMVRYEGGRLPATYAGKLIAVNPLLNYVQLTRIEPDGSSLKNIDERRIVETDDRWFRPVHIVAGPDGAVYMADWYDSRLSHVDPNDTWDKGSGRIYRLRAKGDSSATPAFDLSTYTTDQLVALLSNPNKWFRQQALVQFANRKDLQAIPRLLPLLRQEADGQLALEALWAINLSGGFDEKAALEALDHKDPYVQLWAVRLLGDVGSVTATLAAKLVRLSAAAPQAEVRSQLAATAKRLPAADAIPILKNLLLRYDDSHDPDIPMQIWWAIESKAETDRELVLSLFEDPAVWRQTTTKQFILPRLSQRYAMAGGAENYAAIVRQMELSPNQQLTRLLVSGIKEGLRGSNVVGLSPALAKALAPYQAEFFGAPLALALKQGDPTAVKQVLEIIADDDADPDHRLTYVQILGETDQPSAIPVLLRLVEKAQESNALKQAAIVALRRYNRPDIGVRVLKAYPGFRADAGLRTAAIDMVSSRLVWTRELFRVIKQDKRISPTDILDEQARRFRLLNDPEITAATDRLWPHVKPLSTEEKQARMGRYAQLIRSGNGDEKKGRMLFATPCGICHQLFEEGGITAPDLTGYERSNLNTFLLNVVDPNAEIREGYTLQQITTNDGRLLEGRIVAQEGDVTTIQPLTGRQISISAKQIREMKALPLSVMPERVLDPLSDQEVQDLFAYIMKRP